MFKLGSWKAMVVLSVFCLAMAVASPAQTFTTLVTFVETNGSTPLFTPLIQATDGNFYGTTWEGGASNWGTVFKVTAGGDLTTLYSFCAQSNCPDGNWPQSGLVQGPDGNFYGTTSGGGTNNDGTIFKITSDGNLTTVHSFSGADGTSPTAGLIQGSNGNFYGTAHGGGNIAACPDGAGCGTVFEITPDGKLTTLHSFNGDDGSGPGALIQATDGNLYGTTNTGGVDACPNYPGCGTVFRLTPTGELTTLYSFHGADGWYPFTGLVQGTNGNFYGTTSYGGASNAYNAVGCGTFFVITPGGELTTLHSFDFTDGIFPAPFVQATDGNFYGATVGGGPNGWSPLFPSAGDGTLFEITPGGELTTLHNFDNTNGSVPWSGLVQATSGDFYGTTSQGGTGPTCGPGGCAGTVFSLSTGLAPFVKLTPASGDAGVAVTILGTDLTGTTKVTFNGKAAEFKVVSSTEIAATVPAEASTGKVEVTTLQGALSSNVPFRVELHPKVHFGRPILDPGR